MKKWLIVYSSVTGNTKQIAEAIYDGFGEDMADIFAIRDEFNLEDYDNIAVQTRDRIVRVLSFPMYFSHRRKN